MRLWILETKGWSLFGEPKSVKSRSHGEGLRKACRSIWPAVSRTGLGVLGVPDRLREPWWTVPRGGLGWGGMGLLWTEAHHRGSLVHGRSLAPEGKIVEGRRE